MAGAELRSRVHVTFERGQVPRVRASAVRLGQVILNLVSNAARAAAMRHRQGSAYVRVQTEVSDGHVVVRVTDNGEGLPADGTKLFEPFATKQGSVGGTGLGLFISKRIVESFGGTIELADDRESVDGGAVATVTLPVAMELE